jgi:anti-sigma-K factor RskA
MKLQHIRDNDKLREKLASEYVIGTLRGGARRRFETWLREDAALRRAVAEWQDRLHPMAELTPAVRPSPQVWQVLEKRLALNGSGRQQRSFWRALFDDLRFWRSLGLASTALATMLVVVLLVRQPQGNVAPASYIAMLADDNARPMMVITGDAQHRQLTVKVLAPQHISSDKSLELWALPKQGTPRSLGLVAADGTITLPLPENATPQSVPALAISLEPKGGSPNPDGPTGPVLFKGAWLQV